MAHVILVQFATTECHAYTTEMKLQLTTPLDAAGGRLALAGFDASAGLPPNKNVTACIRTGTLHVLDGSLPLVMALLVAILRAFFSLPAFITSFTIDSLTSIILLEIVEKDFAHFIHGNLVLRSASNVQKTSKSPPPIGFYR
jgi:hypothetical protein